MVVYGSLPIPIPLTNWVAYCTCCSDGICMLCHTRYCSLASNTGCMTLRQPMKKMPHRMLQPCWGIVRQIRIPWLQMGWGVVSLPILLQVEYWSCWSYSFTGCWAGVTSCDVEILSNHSLQSVPSQCNNFRSFQCRPMCLVLLLHWVWWQEGGAWDLIFLNHSKLLLVNWSQIGWYHDIPWVWSCSSRQRERIRITESSRGNIGGVELSWIWPQL